jgi:hypothetical protein
MKLTLHRTNKDCTIPSAALAVAGLKKEPELRLEADNGVIIISTLKNDDVCDDDPLPDDIPETARPILLESGVCIPNLREMLCGNDVIPF